MENTFFHELFQTLTNAEVRQLQKFVASPYFNGRTQLVPLLDYLAACRLRGETAEIPASFAAAFPGEPFDDQKWRLTLSQLFKLAEQFLAQQELEGETNFPKLYLARAYRKRGLGKHFQRTLLALEKAQDGQAQRPAGFYESQFRLESERYRFLSAGRRTEEFNLQKISDVMDIAFIARKLLHVCLSLSHQAVYRVEYRFGLLVAVLTEIKNRPELLEAPAVNLYFQCYLALTEREDEAHFENFKKLLFEQGQLLPDEERRNLFLLAINYGIRQINVSRQEFDRPVLDLYKMALENDLLLENAQLSRFAFNNIVAIGVRIGETDWVENFILKNKNALERSYRNATASLGLARLEYARKNFGEALLHLQHSDFKDTINNLIAKTLQLKIYYESGEYEVLEAHLRNMKNYIRRQRSIGYHRDNYLNIIRFTQALVELNPFDKMERSTLRSTIENEERLTEREWLLEMAG